MVAEVANYPPATPGSSTKPTTTTLSATTPSIHIPTVDISAFLSDHDSPEAQSIIPTVRAACRATGFFQITGHGIPKDLQKAVFAGAKQFFQLPYPTKKALDAHSNPGLRGYDVLASQAYADDLLPDLKEGYFIGIDLPPSDPRVQAGRILMGPNVWPDPSLLPESQFRQPVEAYHAALLSLSLQILRLIERTLPYGPGIFDDFISDDPATPMRMLHYPPAPPTTSDDDDISKRNQYGASAHTDFGAITLLLQDESPGLEVQDHETGAWTLVPPNPDAYVVNIGDMLSFWTRNEYVSSVHRVINRSAGDRYSIVFFFDGNVDTRLAAMDGSEEGENSLTVEQHMINRIRESYGNGKQ